MMKRIFSFLLALCLIVGLLPAVAIPHAHAAVTTATVTLFGKSTTIDLDETTEAPEALYWVDDGTNLPAEVTAEDEWNYSFAIIDDIPTVTLRNANYQYSKSVVYGKYDGKFRLAYEGTNNVFVPYSSSETRYFMSFSASTNGVNAERRVYITGAEGAVLNITGGDNSDAMISTGNKVYVEVSGGTLSVEKTTAGGTSPVVSFHYCPVTIKNTTMIVKNNTKVNNQRPVLTGAYGSYYFNVDDANLYVESWANIGICAGVWNVNKTIDGVKVGGVDSPAVFDVTGKSDIKVVNTYTGTHPYAGTGIYAGQVKMTGGNLEAQGTSLGLRLTNATPFNLDSYTADYNMFLEKDGAAVSEYVAGPYFKLATCDHSAVEGVEEITKNPTCTEVGSKNITYTCAYGHTWTEVEEIPVVPHTPGEGVPDSATGEFVFTCVDCGAEVKREACEHTTTEVVIDGTDFVTKCTVCGAEVKREEAPKLETAYAMTIHGTTFNLTHYDIPFYLVQNDTTAYYWVTVEEEVEVTNPETGEVTTELQKVSKAVSGAYISQTKTGATEENYNAKLIWHSGDATPTLYLRDFVIDAYNEELGGKWRNSGSTKSNVYTIAALFTGDTAPLTIIVDGACVLQTYEGIHYQNELTIKGADEEATLTMYTNRTGIMPTNMDSGYAANGIVSGNKLTLDVNLDITQTGWANADYGDVIMVKGADLVINGGNIVTKLTTSKSARGIGVRGSGNLYINGGYVFSESYNGKNLTEAAIEVVGDFYIADGIVEVKSAYQSGIRAANFYISGGEIKSDVEYATLITHNVDGKIVITGGAVEAVSNVHGPFMYLGTDSDGKTAQLVNTPAVTAPENCKLGILAGANKGAAVEIQNTAIYSYTDKYVKLEFVDAPACEHTNTTTGEEIITNATCTVAGSKKVTVTCDDCGEVISETIEEIAAKGHTEKTDVETKDATCEIAGYTKTTVTCTVCGETISETTEEIKALGHTEDEAVIENFVDSDLNNKGSYDSVVYCSVCNAELKRETIEIPVKEGAVAEVDGVKYATLQEAFDKVQDGGKIQVLTNITFTTANVAYNDGQYIDGIRYNGDKSFTVDFGGFTVTDDGCVNDYLIYMNNKGAKANEITFTNGKIISKNGCWATVCVGATSSPQKTTLNLTNIEIVNSNSVAYAGNEAVRARGNASVNTTVNVNSGAVIISDGAAYGIDAATDGAIVNINDGAKIVQKNSGVSSGNNTYTAVGGKGVINIVGGEIISDMYGVHNLTTGTPVINISGGTITAPVAVMASTNGGAGEKATITITGGTIDGKLENYTNNGIIVVKGGIFSKPVAEKYCAEGFIPVANEDGTFGVKVGKFVAQAGEKKFETLAEAIAVGGEVKLLADVELDAPIVIEKGKTVVLNLGIYKISYTSSVMGEAMITNCGTLTINGEAGSEIYYNYDGAADSTYVKGNYTISNGGNLTVNGGKIYIANLKAHAKYPIDNNSTSGDAVLVINGGHLYNYNTSAIRMFCNSTTNKNSVTINGGLVEGYSAIWMQNPGKATVNGQLTVNGGEIKTTAAAYVNGSAALKDVGSHIYATSQGGAWSADSYAAFNGGIFNENVDVTEAFPAYTFSDEAVFNGRPPHTCSFEPETFDATCTEDGKIVYTCTCGESYEEVIPAKGHTEAEAVVENFVDSTLNSKGSYDSVVYCSVCKAELKRETFVIDEKTGAVAEIEGFKYATLQAAIDAAEAGVTVKLLADIVLTESVTVPAGKTITLDLNGKTVSMETAENAKYCLIYNAGNLTVTDSGENGKLSYCYTGTKQDDAFNTIESAPGSVLTIQGGIIENLSANCLIAYAIDGLTNANGGNVTVNIEGGKISSKKIAVRIFANSTTNIGTLNISGGEIFGRVIIHNASAKANKAALNITGGTFQTNGYKTDVLYVGGSNGASGEITASVTGGTFNGEILSSIEAGFISGGTFNAPVAKEFCAEGYQPKDNGDGTYGVVEHREHYFDNDLDTTCNGCDYIRVVEPIFELDENNKIVVVDPNTDHIYHRVTVYYLGDKTVDDITKINPLLAIDPSAKTYWTLGEINKVQLLNAGNYVVHLNYNTAGSPKYTVAKAFTVEADSAPTLKVENGKLVASDNNANHLYHRVTVYYLGDETVKSIYDVAALKAIDANAKTYWTLEEINKVQLTNSGNYVLHLNYNTPGSDKFTVAVEATVVLSKPTISRDGYKLKVTDSDATHKNHRATIYFVGSQNVDIYDEAALKAIDPSAKTYWGLTAINKAQMATPGTYVIYLSYNLANGVKQTMVVKATTRMPVPSVWLEENGQIGTYVPAEVAHRNYEIYYLGDQTVEDIYDIEALKAIDADPIKFDNQKQIAERGMLTEKGNYVLVMYYNYVGSARQVVAEFATLK